MNWYITVLKKYAVFSGRARRQEYWIFWLFNYVISSIINVIVGSSLNNVLSEWFLNNEYIIVELLISKQWEWIFTEILGVFLSNKFLLFGIIISSIYSLLIIVPRLAVTVRRLHDTGRSAWWLLTLVIAWGFFAISIASAGVGALASTGVFMLFSLLLFIAMFAFLVQDSQAGENQYGKNPKEEEVAQKESPPDNTD